MIFTPSPFMHYSKFELIAATANNGTTSAIDTTGADLLVVIKTGTNTLSDNKGNTWTGLTNRTGTDSLSTRIWYSRGGPVGTNHTFSSGSSSQSVAVAAFSGSAESPFDVQNGTSTGSNGTSVQTGLITPTTAGLIIAGLGTGNTTTGHGINSGFTIAANRPGVASSFYGVAIAFLIQPAIEAVNPTWTWSTSTHRAAVIASFMKR